MSLAPPPSDPRRRMRMAPEVFAETFGLTRVRAAFLSCVYWGVDAGRTAREIERHTGLGATTIRSAYVRTRHLGVETDGQRFWLSDALRLQCRSALDREPA